MCFELNSTVIVFASDIDNQLQSNERRKKSVLKQLMNKCYVLSGRRFIFGGLSLCACVQCM